MFELIFVIFSKLRDLSRFFGACYVLFWMTTNIRTVYIRRSSWISHFLPLGDFLTWEFSSYWLNNKVVALKFTSTGHFQLCFCDLTWNYTRGPLSDCRNFESVDPIRRSMTYQVSTVFAGPFQSTLMVSKFGPKIKKQGQTLYFWFEDLILIPLGYSEMDKEKLCELGVSSWHCQGSTGP